jgi:hypothetical protein
MAGRLPRAPAADTYGRQGEFKPFEVPASRRTIVD